jgi:hypothetical protein
VAEQQSFYLTPAGLLSLDYEEDEWQQHKCAYKRRSERRRKR